MFAEQSPERPATQDDLLLATVHWNGSEVNALYSNDADVAHDRRLVTKGGGTRGISGAASFVDTPMVVDSLLGYLPASATASKWATLVEDFTDPAYLLYPQDDAGVQGSTKPVELTANSLGARNGYKSRIITLGNTLSGTAMDAVWMRLIPRNMRGFPSRNNQFAINVTLFQTSGAITILEGTLGTNPYPPYQVRLEEAFGDIAGNTFHAAQVEVISTGGASPDPSEAFQGFLLHLREDVP